jgi:hypothetical protein
MTASAATSGGVTTESGRRSIRCAMKQWAHHIRLEGNDATHGPDEYSDQDAKDLHTFAELFLTYAFTLPEMLRKATACSAPDVAVREFEAQQGPGAWSMALAASSMDRRNIAPAALAPPFRPRLSRPDKNAAATFGGTSLGAANAWDSG